MFALCMPHVVRVWLPSIFKPVQVRQFHIDRLARLPGQLVEEILEIHTCLAQLPGQAGPCMIVMEQICMEPIWTHR